MVSEVGWSSSNPQSHYPSMETSQKTGTDGNKRFEIYMTASGRDTKSDAIKSTTFPHVAGPEALEVFNTLTFDNEGDEKKLSALMEKFEEYCTPRRNVTWERHVFNTRRQQPGETIDQYMMDLKKKAKSCEFGDPNDSLIKDRVVCGILSEKTRARLLKQPDLRHCQKP